LGGAIGFVVVGVAAIRIVSALTSDDPIERDFTIVRDTSIGGFPRGGTTAVAIEALGVPSARLPGNAGQCTLTWPSRGITMLAVFSDPGNPCGAKGNHVSTTVTDRRWTTDAGLSVGAALSRLHELYPDAPPPDGDGVVVLLERPFSGIPLPSLTAKVANGRVVALTLYGPRRGF
jgi:hypothetical protein